MAHERQGAAVEENFVALLEHYASIPGGEVVRAPDLSLCWTGLPSRVINAAAGARISPETVAARVSESVGWFVARGLPWRWLVGPASRPYDLVDHLIAAGLIEVSDNPAMALEMDGLTDGLDERPAGPPGLESREVADSASFEDWVTVQQESLQMPLEGATAWRDVHRQLGWGAERPLRNFVAHLEGRSVGASALFVGAGVAGIYNVNTVPDQRGRGIGRAITLAALRAGRDGGMRTAVLGSSPLGLPVYRRLGFVEVGRLRSFVPV